jgi:hypothetical protein
MPEPPVDPTLEAELDRALDPYRELVPPDLLAAMRETLADALTTHPVGARLLARVRPPPVVAQSGDVEAGGAAGVEPPVAGDDAKDDVG